jgi:antitoxin component YwqK of YwqJK toxin-antitoxin module
MLDIKPLNENNQPHGYWEYYYYNGQLRSKGNYVNGKAHGYWEWYRYNGQLRYKTYYI